MSSPSRFIGAGVALGLAAGLLVGVALTQPHGAAAAAPPAAPGGPSSGIAVEPGVPATTDVAGGTTAVQAGPAIAYPYFAGTPGVAPDHTIVVTGVGHADLQADGSNQAAAQKSALAAALGDARAQADAIAAGTGLTISGVLSVSASMSPGFGVMPLIANGAGTSSCPVPLPGRVPPANGKTILPQPACPPIYQQTISASVTIEYRVG